MALAKDFSALPLAFLRNSVVPRLNAMARFSFPSSKQAEQFRVKARRYSLWVSKQSDKPFEKAERVTEWEMRRFSPVFDAIACLFPWVVMPLHSLTTWNRFLGSAISRLFCKIHPLSFNYRVLVSLELANPREIDQFLNAIPYVCGTHATKFHLVVSSECVPLVQSILQRLSINEFVEISSDFSTRTLQDAFGRNDLGIFVCSESNGQKNAMQSLLTFASEAYNKQKPIIVGGGQILPRFLVDTDTALIIPQPNASHWSNGINSLLPHPYKRDQMGRLGYQELQAEIDALSILRELEILNCIATGLTLKADSTHQSYQLK